MMTMVQVEQEQKLKTSEQNDAEEMQGKVEQEQQQQENGESIQLLINTFLDTLDQNQDIKVLQRDLHFGSSKSSRGSIIHERRIEILKDIQEKLDQVSFEVDEKKKFVLEKEIELKRYLEERKNLHSNISRLENELKEETAKNERLSAEFKSVNDSLNQEIPLNLSVLTLSVFNQLGIDFIDWNSEKQTFEKFITKSISENRVSSVAMDLNKYSKGYYPDLLWSLVSHISLLSLLNDMFSFLYPGNDFFVEMLGKYISNLDQIDNAMDPLSQYVADENKNTAFSSYQHQDLNGNPFGESLVNHQHELDQIKDHNPNPQLVDANEHEANHTDKDNSEGEGETHERGNHEKDIVTSSKEIISETLDGVPPATSEIFNLNSYDMNQSTVDFLAEQEAAEMNVSCCELGRVIESISLDSFLPIPLVSIDLLRDQAKPIITIEDAGKLQDMSGKSFISYLIIMELPSHRLEARHRYSDFESLRNILVQTYPYISVPPIPSKHSVVDYASKPGKARQDPAIIAKRKRQLQSFLNRVMSHAILRKCHQVHLFLKGEGVWSDIVSSAGLKKKPSTMMETSMKLRKPDVHFASALDYTVRFGNQLTFIRKIHKKIVEQYQDLANIYMDLGALYNGWSLTEHGLSSAIEQIGQATDSTLTATTILLNSLDERLGDLIRDHQKFSVILQSILQARHRLHVEFEQISTRLILKQAALKKLESTENESQRLAAVLATEGGPQIPMARPSGFIAQINALLDSDPDTTRRITISKTKDAIAELEVQREESRTSLLAFNAKIQQNLDRFQKQKIRDLRSMGLVLCLAHREFHSRAIVAWKEAKEVVEKL